MVIEAASEREDIKHGIFAALDQVTPSHAILASNTSSLSITRLAGATSRPDKVIGIHFMNPPVLMRLVELVRGLATSEETFSTALQFAHDMGKTTCVSQDRPGFIVNRILMPMINEAFFALMEVCGWLEMKGLHVRYLHGWCLHMMRSTHIPHCNSPLQQGVATREDIDAGMKLGTNQPMGPLTLADFIGLDTCLAIMRVLHDGLGDTKYRPCPLLVQYVDAGWYGRKTGRGVYVYER